MATQAEQIPVDSQFSGVGDASASMGMEDEVTDHSVDEVGLDPTLPDLKDLVHRIDVLEDKMEKLMKEKESVYDYSSMSDDFLSSINLISGGVGGASASMRMDNEVTQDEISLDPTRLITPQDLNQALQVVADIQAKLDKVARTVDVDSLVFDGPQSNIDLVSEGVGGASASMRMDNEATQDEISLDPTVLITPHDLKDQALQVVADIQAKLDKVARSVDVDSLVFDGPQSNIDLVSEGVGGALASMDKDNEVNQDEIGLDPTVPIAPQDLRDHALKVPNADIVARSVDDDSLVSDAPQSIFDLIIDQISEGVDGASTSRGMDEVTPDFQYKLNLDPSTLVIPQALKDLSPKLLSPDRMAILYKEYDDSSLLGMGGLRSNIDLVSVGRALASTEMDNEANQDEIGLNPTVLIAPKDLKDEAHKVLYTDIVAKPDKVARSMDDGSLVNDGPRSNIDMISEGVGGASTSRGVDEVTPHFQYEYHLDPSTIITPQESKDLSLKFPCADRMAKLLKEYEDLLLLGGPGSNIDLISKGVGGALASMGKDNEVTQDEIGLDPTLRTPPQDLKDHALEFLADIQANIDKMARSVDDDSLVFDGPRSNIDLISKGVGGASTSMGVDEVIPHFQYKHHLDPSTIITPQELKDLSLKFPSGDSIAKFLNEHCGISLLGGLGSNIDLNSEGVGGASASMGMDLEVTQDEIGLDPTVQIPPQDLNAHALEVLADIQANIDKLARSVVSDGPRSNIDLISEGIGGASTSGGVDEVTPHFQYEHHLDPSTIITPQEFKDLSLKFPSGDRMAKLLKEYDDILLLGGLGSDIDLISEGVGGASASTGMDNEVTQDVIGLDPTVQIPPQDLKDHALEILTDTQANLDKLDRSVDVDSLVFDGPLSSIDLVSQGVGGVSTSRGVDEVTPHFQDELDLDPSVLITPHELKNHALEVLNADIMAKLDKQARPLDDDSSSFDEPRSSIDLISEGVGGASTSRGIDSEVTQDEIVLDPTIKIAPQDQALQVPNADIVAKLDKVARSMDDDSLVFDGSRSNIDLVSEGVGGASTSRGVDEVTPHFQDELDLDPSVLITPHDLKNHTLEVLNADIMAKLDKQARTLDDDSSLFDGPRSSIDLISEAMEHAQLLGTSSGQPGPSADPLSSKNLEDAKMDLASRVGTASGKKVPSVDLKPNPSKLVQWVKSLLGSKMFISAADGKYYAGLFYCMDKQGNIFLKDAVEYTPINTESASNTESFQHSEMHKSLVLIPITIQRSVQIEDPFEEQLEENSPPQSVVRQPAATPSEPPYEGLVKLNYAAVISSEDGALGMGFVARRDDNGKMLGWKQIKVPSYSMDPVEVEASAVRDVLCFAIDRGLLKVVLESGNQELVEKLNKADADSPSDGLVIHDIKSIVPALDSFRLLYAPSSCDTVALNLAKSAKRCVVGYDTPPDIEMNQGVEDEIMAVE